MRRGIEHYTTKDKVRVMKLHYSADHEKDPATVDGLKWFYQELEGYPGGMEGTKWQREMEISFVVRGVTNVFPNWSEREQYLVIPHLTKDTYDRESTPMPVPDHWPIYMGYDYGHRNPFAAIFMTCNGDGLWFIIDELYAAGKSIPAQVDMIKSSPYWPRVRMCIGDPSIWFQTQHTPGSYKVGSTGEQLMQAGINIFKGPNDNGLDIHFRNLLLTSYWKDVERPKMFIMQHCKNTIREFRHLKHKDYITRQANENNPLQETIVSKRNHAWDATKYVMMAKANAAPDKPNIHPESLIALRRRLKQRRNSERYIFG